MRFKVNLGTFDTTVIVEKHIILKVVEEDRRYSIQASLVRIMKSKKELTHVELVGEMIGLCREQFTPNVPLIKNCIEQLIDKNYIERKGTDTYLYVS